jgi:hypothetical protein
MFGKILSRIALFFFKDIVKLFNFDLVKFDKIIKYINIDENSVTYISNVLLLSFIAFVVFEIFLIFVMIKLNIYFNILSFIITIILSLIIFAIVFFLFYRYPYYLLNTKKKEFDFEIEKSISHLSVIADEKLSIIDVLNLLQNLEGNVLLSIETKAILTISNLNHNLRDTLNHVIKTTYSMLEKDFFEKLVLVYDKKANLSDILADFVEVVHQSKKEQNDERKSKVNLLFQISVFLFFFVIILLFVVFLVPFNQEYIKKMLYAIAIAFPIVEFILMIILYK